jgi:4-amino-4-deoxy-L-arabinose transferase-like glycosyltransferase
MTFRKFVNTLFSPLVVTIIFLLLTTAFTRFRELGSVPTGITWDEAALGYVGAMVDQTGRDEYNRLLPRVFESFGDYKAPLALYITGVSTSVFGMQPWAVRLPYALASFTLVFVIMRISWLSLKKTWLAFASGWLALTLPWLLHLGRIGFESGLCLLFLTISIWSWLEIRQRKNVSPLWWFAFAGGIVASLYVYHSAKILAPGLIVVIGLHEWFYNRQWLSKQRKSILLTLGLITALLLPFIQTLVAGKGLERAAQTSLFNHSEGSIVVAFARNILLHLDTRFLIGGETDSLRHGTGKFGVFLLSHFLLFCLGIALIIGRYVEQFLSTKKHPSWKKMMTWFATKFTADHTHEISPLFWILLLILGIVPAAIGFEVPHANRALFAALPAIFIMTIGIAEIRKDIAERVFAMIIGCLFLFQLLEFGSFYKYYFSEYPKTSSADWMERYSDAARLTWEAQGNGRTIKFTSQYGQPEIFFAFANDVPFEMYRWERIPGMTFGPVTDLDKDIYTYVVAGSKEKLDSIQPTQVLLRADGEPAFYIYDLLQ